MGVFGERGPWDELGELAIELISSSLMAWCGVIGVEAAAVHIIIHTQTQTYVHRQREKLGLK